MRREEAAKSCMPGTELIPRRSCPTPSAFASIHGLRGDTVKLPRTGVRQLRAAAPSELEKLV